MYILCDFTSLCDQFFFLFPALSKRDGHKRSSLVSALVSTPSSRSGGVTVGGARVQPSSSSKADTARRHIVSELLQTEKNFVDILHIIVKVSGNGSLKM